MSALITGICVFTVTIQPIFNKQFNLKCKNGQIVFCTIFTLCALLFFVAITDNINITAKIAPYSVLFSVCYLTALVSNIFALKIGSLAITSLVMSYSLVIPTVYGLIFLNEQAGICRILGILALFISLFLIRLEKSSDVIQKSVSVKWILLLIIGFLMNGFSAVVQNEQRRRFHNAENGNYMILSLIISFVILAAISIWVEGKDITVSLKKGTLLAAMCGISNGATNWLAMLAVSMIPASEFYPFLSAGQIVLTYFISVVFYKEKFIKRQKIGIVFGIIALALLNV